MIVEEIQIQIDQINEELESLIKERAELDWIDAPVICELNGSRWILGPEAPEELNWDDAVEWCQSAGGELPSRDILLKCYLNEEIIYLFSATDYWSCVEFDDSNAWFQDFYNGNQSYFVKSFAKSVRAVRKLPI